MATTAQTAKITYRRRGTGGLYPKQYDAVFTRERYAVVEATTKSGKTVACIKWLVEQASTLGGEGRNYWWVAPVYPQAKVAFRRLKRGIPREIYIANESEMTIALENGSVIWFKSGEKPDNLYGEDVYAAVIDEATRLREESWHAIRTTLTRTKGPVRIIGNVKGRKNWAYKLARKAEAGEADMHYARITAWDAIEAGILDRAEIEDAKRQLPEAVFNELYLAEPSDDEGNPFGLEAIRACIKPLSGKEPKAWGWDLAKSVDWTVGIALDEKGDTCRFVRFQLPWQETIVRIRQETRGTPALVDSTGVGDPILEALQRDGGDNFEGYKFSSSSKQQLMEGLAVSIQRDRIGFPEGVITSELESFGYVYIRTGVKYCLAPETRVLTADLRHVSVASLSPGDSLIAFDESRQEGKSRKWRRAEVAETSVIELPSYDIFLADGTKVQASAEHKWLVHSHGNGNIGDYFWLGTKNLRGRHSSSKSLRHTPHKLVRLTDVWSDEKSYEAGYLAAAFDGEGCIQQGLKQNGGRAARLTMAQRDNELASEIRRCLAHYNFQWSEHCGERNVISFGVTGRRHEFLRFLGQIRPKRLLAKFNPELLGTLEKKVAVPIERVEYVGMMPVIAIGTSTQTLIAEGLASHNSAPEGMHDDCVCSLALANHLLGVGDSERPEIFFL